MYDELVNSLRICGKMRSVDDYCVSFHDGCCEAEPVCMYELMQKAANAIEELSRAADAIPHVCECCIGCEVESGGCDYGFVLSPKRAKEYLSKPRWIPVTERRAELPCICYDANGNMPFIPHGIVTIKDDQGVWQIDAGLADPILHQGKITHVLGYGNRITHWMPLPEPPKAEEGE